MKILSHQDICSLKLDTTECFAWVEDMLKHKSSSVLPPKISLHINEGSFINIMPSVLPRYDAAGVKVVSRYHGRTPLLDSQIVLINYTSGLIEAILDGNFITTMRTGAVAAHSILEFAQKDFSTVGFIGLGNQARATIKVLLAQLEKRKFVFHLFKYKDQHVQFQDYVRSLGHAHEIEFVVFDSYEEVVANSQVIVSSATYFAQDICSDECFKKGCLLVPIHSRGFSNCDLFFDRIFCDDIGHVTQFKNFSKFKRLNEVAEVLNGQCTGREHEDDRILSYNIGLSIFDVYFARKIYQRALEAGLGSEADLQPPTDKIWF